MLNHFARLGGVRSPAELAQAFQVSKGAMTNTLQRLEAGRLVKIIPDPAEAALSWFQLRTVENS